MDAGGDPFEKIASMYAECNSNQDEVRIDGYCCQSTSHALQILHTSLYCACQQQSMPKI